MPGERMPGERYTYGDTEVAARRLAIVAEVFEPTTRAFLERSVRRTPALAIDLGCGPGHTTRLIHQTLHPSRTVGLDRSSAFVDRARGAAPSGVGFFEHDARETPFPVGPADLVYARLLLAHLAEPREVVAGWATQLRPGGLLLLDEMEPPDADDGALSRYLAIALRVVRSQGGALFAGADLHAMPDPPGTERVADDLVDFRPAAAKIALMCRLNLDVLRASGELAGDDPELDSVALGLDAIVRGERPLDITWRVRQIAYRRSAEPPPAVPGAADPRP